MSASTSAEALRALGDRVPATARLYALIDISALPGGPQHSALRSLGSRVVCGTSLSAGSQPTLYGPTDGRSDMVTRCVELDASVASVHFLWSEAPAQELAQHLTQLTQGLAYRRAAGRHADIKEELLGFQKQLISALRIQHETAPTPSSTEAATSATFLRRQPAYLDTSVKTLLAAWDAPDITPEAMALYAHLFNDAHRDWLDQWMPTDNGIHPLFRVRLVSGLESQVDKVTKQATEPVKKKVAEYNAPEAVQRRQWDREADEYRRAVPPLPR